MLSLADGKKLINLAKKTISLSFDNKKPDLEEYKNYDKSRGVFVTLHKKGELRGCIGFPTPVYPLNEAVAKASIAAAFEDPRFPPVTKDELEEIDVEISVLTVPEQIKSISPEEIRKEIVIGRDGLIIEKPYTSGLLLPQIAPEWGWDSLEFLENTCQKAGLPPDAWKENDTRIYTFQAQIFTESKGQVIEKK